MKEIYVDGSCRGNPGPGGWAAIVVEDNKVIDAHCGYFNDTTNNRMELTAIIWSIWEYHHYEQSIIIYSDSAYCVNMYNNWIDTWEKNGWTRSNNQPIENFDLVKQLYLTKKFFHNEIIIMKITGHSGVKYNELADKLAKHEITPREIISKYGR